MTGKRESEKRWKFLIEGKVVELVTAGLTTNSLAKQFHHWRK